jgi:hypothetical protein
MRSSSSILRALLPIALASSVVAPGCGDGASPPTMEPSVPPDTYAFQSRFEPEISSVGYAGQTMRHVLLLALTEEIEGLTEAIDDGDIAPENEGDVVALLDTYFRFDSDLSGGLALPELTTTPRASSDVRRFGFGEEHRHETRRQRHRHGPQGLVRGVHRVGRTTPSRQTAARRHVA